MNQFIILAVLLHVGLMFNTDAHRCQDKLMKSTCEKLASKSDACNTQHLRKYMLHNCPLTCGACAQDSGKDTCTDLAPSAGCRVFKSKQGGCGSGSRHYRYTSSMCKETCGLCPVDAHCNDLMEAEDCKNFLIYSGDSCLENRFLAFNCQKTCGHC